MTGTQQSLVVRVAGVLAGCGLSLAAVAPIAHATPLDDQNAIITGDRNKYAPNCPPLTWNPTLEAIANGVLNPDIPNDNAPKYNGEMRGFNGSGDPQSAALTAAYKDGAGNMLSACDFTEFGSGFWRWEEGEEDFVAIVFGKPAAIAPPRGPGVPGGIEKPAEQAPPPPPPVKCPPGGPKAEVPAGEKCPAPANAIKVSFQRSLPQWTVNVTNSAGIGGRCIYTANSNNGSPGTNNNFDIGPNGKASFKVNAPLPLTGYHVVTSCVGTYDGQQVELGRDEQDVP